MSEPHDPAEERELPVKVIEHDGVIKSDRKGLSDSERGFSRWMDDHVPPDVEDELAVELADEDD